MSFAARPLGRQFHLTRTDATPGLRIQFSQNRVRFYPKVAQLTKPNFVREGKVTNCYQRLRIFTDGFADSFYPFRARVSLLSKTGVTRGSTVNNCGSFVSIESDLY